MPSLCTDRKPRHETIHHRTNEKNPQLPRSYRVPSREFLSQGARAAGAQLALVLRLCNVQTTCPSKIILAQAFCSNLGLLPRSGQCADSCIGVTIPNGSPQGLARDGSLTCMAHFLDRPTSSVDTIRSRPKPARSSVPKPRRTTGSTTDGPKPSERQPRGSPDDLLEEDNPDAASFKTMLPKPRPRHALPLSENDWTRV